MEKPVQKMTKEEVVALIRERSRGRNDYTDVYCENLEVEACEIAIENTKYLVPENIGLAVAEIVENVGRNNEIVPLGNFRFRAYMIKTLEFKRVKFKELNDWAKSVILEERPDLFSEWEEKFSPELKKLLEEWKKGPKGRGLKPLVSKEKRYDW